MKLTALLNSKTYSKECFTQKVKKGSLLLRSENTQFSRNIFQSLSNKREFSTRPIKSPTHDNAADDRIVFYFNNLFWVTLKNKNEEHQLWLLHEFLIDKTSIFGIPVSSKSVKCQLKQQIFCWNNFNQNLQIFRKTQSFSEFNFYSWINIPNIFAHFIDLEKSQNKKAKKRS